MVHVSKSREKVIFPLTLFALLAEDELGTWFETTGRRSEIFLATKFGAWIQMYLRQTRTPGQIRSRPISKER